jgi:hypothetical protein
MSEPKPIPPPAAEDTLLSFVVHALIVAHPIWSSVEIAKQAATLVRRVREESR